MRLTLQPGTKKKVDQPYKFQSKFNQSKMFSVMSQKEANEVNKVFRTVVIVAAAVLGIAALIYNPGHLFTAGIVFAFGCEAEIAKADEFDLRK